MAQALNSSSLATTSILLLLLHLFLFSSPTTATTTTTTTTPVLDIEGNPLEVGSEYYIRQAIGFFGGLRLRSRSNSSCPKFVFRKKIAGDPGRPVKFRPLRSTQKTIDVSESIYIAFTGKRICDGNAWLPIKDSTNGQIYVSTGLIPLLYMNFIQDFFSIEKMGNLDGLYKISYTRGRRAVRDIGILEENGISWLGVSHEPLPVCFVKKPKEYNKVE